MRVLRLRAAAGGLEGELCGEPERSISSLRERPPTPTGTIVEREREREREWGRQHTRRLIHL